MREKATECPLNLESECGASIYERQEMTEDYKSSNKAVALGRLEASVFSDINAVNKHGWFDKRLGIYPPPVNRRR